MRKLILLFVVLAVIAAGWLLYFNSGDSAKIVNLCEVKYMDLENSLEFSGQVVPKKMYSVMSETGGTIDTIYVSEGSKVNKGDALFDIDSSQIKTLLKEAELKYNMLLGSESQAVMAPGVTGLAGEKAKIALALSQTTGYDYESFNNAFSGELEKNAQAMAASLNNMQSLKEAASAEPSSSSLELAELEVERLRAQLENMSYKSLLNGTVIAVNIRSGEVLAPGVPAMVIADTEDSVIEGYVYEKDLSNLAVGMNVKIVDEDVYYMGKISSIGHAAAELGEQSNYGAMAKVQITPGKGFKKIPGAIVDLEVMMSSKKDVLAVPIECLADKNSVYVVGKDDKLEKRTVETGFQDTFYVEILSGLSEGEKVVLTPGSVQEGQTVTYDRG
ncbi:MAG: efflux RND transporter periplasmic adaptor subunit [Burkholderiales bacterium]